MKTMLGAAPAKKTAGSCVRQNLNLFAFEQTRSPQYEHTHSAERRLIRTDNTVCSIRHL